MKKYISAILGTTQNMFIGGANISFNTLENWQNLEQAILELQKLENYRTHYWEQFSYAALKKGEIDKSNYLDKGNIVNPNTWITLELSNTDNFRHIYVRRKFANRIAINDCAHTPMEARNMDNDITYNFRTRELTMLFYKCRPINTHAYYDTIDTAFEWVDRIKRFFEDLEENDD